MPFEIVRNDITNMQVDAIVNTASPKPGIGYGVDAGIHQKAGPQLLKAREKLGNIRVGDAAITPAFQLSAKYVIHAVSPVWLGGDRNEVKLLKSCYLRCLKLAKQNRCESVAFPLLSAGNHGFPKPLALQTAMGAISEFLMKNEMRVYLVVFSRDAFQLSEKLFHGVTSFIDEHYIEKTNLRQYGVADKCSVRGQQQAQILEQQMRQRTMDLRREAEAREDLWELSPAPQSQDADEGFDRGWTGALPPCPPAAMMPAPPMAAPQASCAVEEASKAPKEKPRAAKKSALSLLLSKRAKPSLEELLRETDAGFSETLLKLIDQTGKKDSEIYTRANVSRQHFSKIRNNPGYKPTKATAIAFAIALELDLDQTEDLIGRAGYALTTSSKFDLIIMYFIGIRNYNMYEINATLFEFDQSLLGA